MRKNVYRMTDPATKLKLIAVHFRAGKVTKRKPRSRYTSRTPSASGSTLSPSGLSVKKEMQLTCPTYNLLSVRKGRLQDLARQGMSKSCLLHHSRHATIDMLDRYLGWGSWNLEAARERFLWRESLYLPGRVEEQRPP
jgi:hypothetical protein